MRAARPQRWRGELLAAREREGAQRAGGDARRVEPLGLGQLERVQRGALDRYVKARYHGEGQAPEPPTDGLRFWLDAGDIVAPGRSR